MIKKLGQAYNLSNETLSALTMEANLFISGKSKEFDKSLKTYNVTFGEYESYQMQSHVSYIGFMDGRHHCLINYEIIVERSDFGERPK